MKKRILSVLLVAVMVVSLLAACGTSEKTPVDAGTTAKDGKNESQGVTSGMEAVEGLEANAPEAPTTTGAGVKIGFVSTGVLGDKALTDTTWAGLNKLKEDYPDVEIIIYESPNGTTDWEPNIIAASEWADLVIVNASSCGEILLSVAERFPDVYYVANEFPVEDNPQFASDVYACNEVAFLLGCLAGLFTQNTDIPGINEEHVVGYISGMEAPTTLDYFTGFEAGAKFTCPDVTVLQSWTGSYTDPLLAKEMTKGMISQGADCILGCISSAVVGVFEACDEADIYSLGLDTNKDADYEGKIITSGLKCGDVTSYKFGKEFIEGTWEPGFILMDCASGALDITDMATIKKHLQMDVIDDYYNQAIEIRDDLRAGKIEVPYIPAARGEE